MPAKSDGNLRCAALTKLFTVSSDAVVINLAASSGSSMAFTINSGNSSNFENIGGTAYNDALTGDSNANNQSFNLF